jgi:hypothetical protein
MQMLYALLKSVTLSVSLSSLHVARTLSWLIGRHHHSDLFATVNILRGVFATVEKCLLAWLYDIRLRDND